MFRMLLHSSSGAGDCMWVYCSVRIDVYALASCLLVSVCGFIGAWCVIIMCPGYVILSYARVITFITTLVVSFLVCCSWRLGAVRLE